jgi:hypothetical protein
VGSADSAFSRAFENGMEKIRLRFCEVALITGWLNLAVRTFSSSTTVLILSRQGNQKSTYAEKTAQAGHRQQQKRFHCSVVDVGENVMM